MLSDEDEGIYPVYGLYVVEGRVSSEFCATLYATMYVCDTNHTAHSTHHNWKHFYQHC